MLTSPKGKGTVDFLNAEINKFQFSENYVNGKVGERHLKKEFGRWSKVIKEVGIRIE